MPRSVPWFLLVVLLVGLFVARESRRPGPVGGLDRAFFDWLTANVSQSANPPPSPLGAGVVTLIELDDSLAETPGRLPLSALDYALFLQAAGKFDPAVIAIEPALDWPNAQPGNEQILVDQALGVPKLLLGALLGNADEIRPAAVDLPALDNVRGDRAALIQFSDVIAAPNPRLLPLAACGATNLPAPGIAVREAPLLFRCRGKNLPGFVLQALALWLQLAPSEVAVAPGEAAQFGDRLRVPIDRAGRALLDASVFPRINRIDFDDLLLLTAGQSPPTPALAAAAARMKGGIVLLGRTDRAARVYPVPGGRMASSAEILAWAVASLRERPVLHRASAWWDGGIIVAAALLGLAMLGHSRRRGLWLCVLGLGSYALTALAAFQTNGLWLPLALPLALGLCAGSLLWFLPTHRRE